jgi:sugar lactone lactonase YvrE
MIAFILFAFPARFRAAAGHSLGARWILRTVGAAIALAVAGELSAQTFVTEWNAADARLGPTGMLVADEGGTSYLYVSDQPGGRVVKFNAGNGTIVSTFGQVGDGPGDLNSPYGLARDPATGDIYVAERGNNRISRFTRSGAFVLAWGAMGTAPGEFNEPTGVAVNAAGDVFVCDHANHRIQKFRVTQANGTWSAAQVGMWGSQGSGPGQFNLPYGISSDAQGTLWVADGFNGRVQHFDANGNYLSSFGSIGSGPGQFLVVTSVNLDVNGDLLVTSTNSDPQNGALADANNQWVSRFTASGGFVSRWGGSYGEAGGQFRLPFSAVAGPNNRVFVADYYNTRVQVFDVPSSGGNAKITGSATEVGPNIVHPNGNVYDQILLTGASATVTADPGQITRVSFLDLNDDIVQVEFSGAGSLAITLENPSGPAAPAKYNQPTVSYMKGHASLAIAGANETTNVSVFSVGTETATNQALFPAGMSYDGIADIGLISITSTDGRFGGIRTANAAYFRAAGMTGINAPGVTVTGPVYVGDITADSSATGMLMLAGAAEIRITGGDCLQLNNRAIQVGSVSPIAFTSGTKSNGQALPAQVNRARFERNGTDVTSQVVR